MRADLIIGCCVLFAGCAATHRQADEPPSAGISIEVQNPLPADVHDGIVVINRNDMTNVTSESGNWSVTTDGQPLDFQWNDSNQDGNPDQLTIVLDVPANGKRLVTINPADQPQHVRKRTHAEIGIKEGGTWKDRVYQGGAFVDVDELAVPPEHTDHSFYIRYEGPGWESELVGYRFYLDWRNATDIFGKIQDALVLDKVGLDGFDSYHELSDWGMDILKVGDALGVGALGCWSEGRVLRMAQTDSIICSIPMDGAVESMVRTQYSGWATPFGKTDVTSELAITAGSRLTHHHVMLSAQIDSLCTGIVKHPGVEVLTKDSGAWRYLATWGMQSLANDSLGMAIFYRQEDALGLREDNFNEVVLLKPKQHVLDYYFAACWEREAHGIKTRAAFRQYLDDVVDQLNHPLTWKVLQ